MCIRISQFCCFTDLRTGAVVAAVVNALGVVWLLTTAILLATNEDEFTRHHADEYEYSVQAFFAYGGLYFIGAAVEFAILLSLVIGVKKKEPAFFLPWLIVSFISIICSVKTAVWDLPCSISLCELTPEFWVVILVHCYLVYLWIAVNSYSLELKDDKYATTKKVRVLY